jgi:hypothetical protein
MIRPLPAGDHLCKRQLGQDECTAKVHLDRLPPFGRPGLPGRPDRPADAGVVDENVYRAQPFAQFGDGGGGGPPVGDVSSDGSGDAARPVDLADRGRKFTRGPCEASAATAHQGDHAF